jgi:predicted RNase H-like nuclease (RuvC/YqgF family)
MYLFRGAVGVAFHRLYQPVMPFKDELAMLAPMPTSTDKKEAHIARLEAKIRELEETNNRLEKANEQLRAASNSAGDPKRNDC